VVLLWHSILHQALSSLPQLVIFKTPKWTYRMEISTHIDERIVPLEIKRKVILNRLYVDQDRARRRAIGEAYIQKWTVVG
jgi:hypothetical protein